MESIVTARCLQLLQTFHDVQLLSPSTTTAPRTTAVSAGSWHDVDASYRSSYSNISDLGHLTNKHQLGSTNSVERDDNCSWIGGDNCRRDLMRTTNVTGRLQLFNRLKDSNNCSSSEQLLINSGDRETRLKMTPVTGTVDNTKYIDNHRIGGAVSTIDEKGIAGNSGSVKILSTGGLPAAAGRRRTGSDVERQQRQRQVERDDERRIQWRSRCCRHDDVKLLYSSCELVNLPAAHSHVDRRDLMTGSDDEFLADINVDPLDEDEAATERLVSAVIGESHGSDAREETAKFCRPTTALPPTAARTRTSSVSHGCSSRTSSSNQLNRSNGLLNCLFHSVSALHQVQQPQPRTQSRHASLHSNTLLPTIYDDDRGCNVLGGSGQRRWTSQLPLNLSSITCTISDNNLYTRSIQQQQQQSRQCPLQPAASRYLSTPVICDLSRHEMLQIELFYGGYATEVLVSSSTARLYIRQEDEMASRPPIGTTLDHHQMPVKAASDLKSVTLKSRKSCIGSNGSLPAAKTNNRLPPNGQCNTHFTASSWSFIASGVPVIVTDSGLGRRPQHRVLLLAERGSGFALWSQSISIISSNNNNNRGMKTGSVNTIQDDDGSLPESHTSSNWVTVSLTATDSKSSLTTIGFQFTSTAAADEFKSWLRTSSVPLDRKSTMRGKMSAVKNWRGKCAKSDISAPCCFMHVTHVSLGSK